MHPTYIRKVLSKLKKGWTPKTNYEIMLVEKGEHIKFKGEKGAGIKKHMKISKDLARLLGFFCAEGHITQHSKRPNSYTVEFSFGKHEKEQIKEVFDLFYRIFGIELTKRERRSVIALTSVSSSIGTLFNKLCGQGAKNKKVPFFLFNSSKEIIKEFLNAYDTGDGWGGRGEHPISMNTVSKDLALDIFYLFLKLNYLPCFYVWNPPRKKNIEGREVNQSTLYYIKLYAEEFRRRFHDKSYEGIVSKKSKDNLRFKEDSDYFYVPIKETKDHPYNGHVYNLEIEDDHSYLANFVSAGNCQNWDISQIEKEAQIMGKEVNPEEVVEEALNMECEGIAYTYNEPAINIEFVRDTARIAKKKGLKNVLVTNGYFTKKSFDYLNKDKLIDAMNIDLKAFKDETYKKHCNAIHGIQPVLDTIKRAHNAGIHLELTTLVIPDLNDSESELRKIAEFIFSLDQGGENIPWHISRFFPTFKFSYGKREPTSVEKLNRAKEIGEEVGLKKVYLGNI